MSDPTPERPLPAEIEQVMREVTAASFDLQDIMGRELVDELPRVMDRLKQAEGQLRTAILAALEPERAVVIQRQTFERVLRWHEIYDDEGYPFDESEVKLDRAALQEIEAVLTATNSANVRRE